MSYNNGKNFVRVLNAVGDASKADNPRLLMRLAQQTINVQCDLNAKSADFGRLYEELAEAQMVLTGDATDDPKFDKAMETIDYVTKDLGRFLTRFRQNARRISEFRLTGRISR